MSRPKGSKNKKGAEKIYKEEPIVIKYIGDYITLERIQKVKRCTLYKYTKIEYENEEPIEIVEYFDKNKYYVDKVIRDYNSLGYARYREVRIVRDSINRLINFKYNKPVIIKGKNYKVTIYTESRNILVGKRASTLKYLGEEPYVDDDFYIISYADTLDQERRFFNG